MPRPSNDTLQLSPRTELEGPALELDFPGLEIGCAEYDEGPTGCTVFHFPDGASVQTDIRGGSPGTFGGGYEWVNAICLAGGSLYGLEAVSGVAAELFALVLHLVVGAHVVIVARASSDSVAGAPARATATTSSGDGPRDVSWIVFTRPRGYVRIQDPRP